MGSGGRLLTDREKHSLTMAPRGDRPVIKLKDMEEKHLHNLFLKNMSGLIEEVKNPTPRLNPNSKCGGVWYTYWPRYRAQHNQEEVPEPTDGGHFDLVSVQDQEL